MTSTTTPIRVAKHDATDGGRRVNGANGTAALGTPVEDRKSANRGRRVPLQGMIVL
jgi:hypothetical protein